MTVRDAVIVMNVDQAIHIVNGKGEILEGEAAGYLTADYLEEEVDMVSSRVLNIGKTSVSYIEIKIKGRNIEDACQVSVMRTSDKNDIHCSTVCELEDGIEKGTVVLLPCNVSDTVYCLIDENNELDSRSKHICSSKVEGFSIEKHGEHHMVVFHLDFWNTDINPRTLCVFVEDCIDKTVFIHLEDAEKAISERSAE